ncbi:alpha/beta hydrolase fold domain-containing protein [Agromyces sp. MMS24-K17]|uniref:alpha/beta hydrolase fold domain-containing protein n=1 Tax=Agromyces sp. MMS24-K17 TaxID=3372850 RepID=UPI0037549270
MITRPSGGHGRRRRRPLLIAAAVAAALVVTGALSGFHLGLQEIDPHGADAASEVAGTEVVGIRTFVAPIGLRVDEDLEYGTRDDGTLLTLDVCSPATAGTGVDLPAVVSIHGGSWARGDKANADWRNVCLWLASEGFVAASVNYRLVPQAVFPAQLDDVSLAVEWLRDDEQAERFGIDPARIGVFGGSAGGNLAALLGAAGEGPLDEGARVAAVAELSGPVALDDLDGASTWLRGIVGAYVGCDPDELTPSACTTATDASPLAHLDASDPPFFIGHAVDEIIPLAQSTTFAFALQTAGVEAELAVVDGSEHSIGILDEALRARVAAFLHAHLG